MKIKVNKENFTVDVITDEGMKYSLKIRNVAPAHSFPRMCIIDLNSGKVMASLSGGGSYGWIINCRDLRRRSLLLKVARKANQDNIGGLWTNVQC